MFNERLSQLAVDMQAEAMARLLSGGFLRLYDGEQPTSVDDIPLNTLLAELRFKQFTSSADGIVTALELEPEMDAPASGTATWFRCLTSKEKPVCDGTVGRTDANMTMRTTEIRKGAEVFIESYKHVATKQHESIRR